MRIRIYDLGDRNDIIPFCHFISSQKERSIMNNESAELIEKLRRELRFSRIISLISILLTVCLVGVVLYFQQTVQTVVEPVTEQLAGLDTDTLNEAIANLEVVSDELAQADIDWEELADTINSLDVEAFNEAIAGFDTEELSEAIENLNNAIEALENLGNGASSVTGWLFGGD